jgi:hypothetical protein
MGKVILRCAASLMMLDWPIGVDLSQGSGVSKQQPSPHQESGLMNVIGKVLLARPDEEPRPLVLCWLC